MSKVLILGHRGVLGSILKSYLQTNGYEVLILEGMSNNQRVDITDSIAVANLKNLEFDTLVNCAAKTNLMDGQKEPQIYFETNGLALKSVALLCREQRARLIHISTDAAYYTGRAAEDADVRLPNIYAASKYLGDVIVSTFPDSLTIRTNFISCGQVQTGLGKYLLDCINGRIKDIRGYSDVYCSLVHVMHLIEFIDWCIRTRDINGIVNFGIRGDSFSKYYLIKKILELLQLPFQIDMVAGEQFRPPRNLNTSMDSSKAERLGYTATPDFDNLLDSILNDVQNG